jgi:hypothetical protein
MKFKITIVIILFFLLAGCGKDPDTRTVKVDISQIKDCPAGEKLTAIMCEEPATGFRLKKDMSVPGSAEFDVICKKERKIWIQFTGAGDASKVDLIDLKKYLNVYVDGEKITYGPVPGGSEYGIVFTMNKKK